MGSGLIGTGLTGLHAAQLALQTTEHNIANVNTPGFSRQRTLQVGNPGVLSGSGFIGQGTRVATVERMYDKFLSEQVNRAQARASELTSYHQQLAQIDNMLADSATGLSPVLQEFFQVVQQSAANPGQLAVRQAMVSSAQGLAARYRSLGEQLGQIADGVNEQIATTVEGINSYAEQIAALNQSVVLAEASTGQPANDLRDTRDQLVLDLNKLIKTSTTAAPDGSINVFVGSGQQLVVGARALTLTVAPSAADPNTLAVGLRTAAGATQEIPEKLLAGGGLGGLLSFRRESLSPAINDLGRNAASFALTFNAQSALGQDLLGQSQLSAAPNSFAPNVFTLFPPAVTASTRNPVGSPLVSASFIDPPPFKGNFYTDLGSSDYRLSSDGTNVTLTRLADSKVWTGADVSAVTTLLASDPQGFTLASSAPLPAGSSYLIQPVRDAASGIAVNSAVAADPRLLALAGPLRTSSAASNTGSATVSAATTGPGYTAAAAALPIAVTYQSGGLQNFPVGARVSIDGGAPVLIAAATDRVPYTSGANITLVGSVAATPPVGFNFTISGVPNNGDTFVIGRNSGATADGRNALALGQLQTQDTMSGKTDSFLDSYGQLVSAAGSRTRQMEVRAEAQQVMLEQAVSSRESFSGVNLDEEAANLIRYQQAYQAAAKTLQVATSLFDTILDIL